MSYFKLIIVCLSALQLFEHEVNAEIDAHDLKCPITNKKYLNNVDVFMYSDSTINEFYAKFTIVRPIPTDAMGHLKVLKRSNAGVYDIPTDFKFNRRFCETVREPTSWFWYQIYVMLFDECPTPVGTYSIEKLQLIDDEHERFFKTSLSHSLDKYMLIFFVTHGDETILYCHVHYDVVS